MWNAWFDTLDRCAFFLDRLLTYLAATTLLVITTQKTDNTIYMNLQDSLDKLMHFLPQLSDFVTLKNGFFSFRAQTD